MAPFYRRAGGLPCNRVWSRPASMELLKRLNRVSVDLELYACGVQLLPALEREARRRLEEREDALFRNGESTMTDNATHARRYAAVIRPVLDRIPGWNPEDVDYLVDRSTTHGGDCDEFRCLQRLARKARSLCSADTWPSDKPGTPDPKSLPGAGGLLP